MWLDNFSGFFSSAGIIVIIAATLQSVAYVFKNQIILRVLLLIGTALYMLYYFVAAEQPLWAAIFGTSCIASTSVFGLARALVNRSTLMISQSHLPIYRQMGIADPGAFRKLMKTAQIKTYEKREAMTKLGAVPDHVYYTLKGEVDISKSDFKFSTGAYCFIGEISIIGGFAATATVYSRPGTKVVVWNRQELLAQMKTNERFRIAVEALFSKDMAIKLAQAAKVC